MNIYFYTRNSSSYRDAHHQHTPTRYYKLYPTLQNECLLVWRLTRLCLIWCIQKEQNAWTFEDTETLVEELRKNTFKSIFIWITAQNSLFFSSFSYILNCSFSPEQGSFVYFLCNKVEPLCACLMRLIYLSKKKFDG